MKIKNDTGVIVILLIVCFIIIPVISQLFVKEGFYNLDTIGVNRILRAIKGPNGITEFNTETRVKFKDRTEFEPIQTFLLEKEDRPNQDISYNFCIGKLTCDPGYDMKKLELKDTDNTNLYYPYCVSGNKLADLKCEGGIKNATRAGDKFDSEGFTPLFSFNRYKTSDNPYYFTKYDLNLNRNGLKKVEDLLECDYISDSKQKIACSDSESDNKYGSITNNSSPEYLASLASRTEQRLRELENKGRGSSSSTSNIEPANSNSTSGDSIKCVADFGTEKGEPLCCGQTGVLQSSKYTCPHTMPYCSDFKCGSKFGTCRK